MSTHLARIWLRPAAVFIALAVVMALAMLAPVASFAATGTKAVAAADTEGCGYGESGPYADTICWIDISDFDAEKAQSADGQPMTISFGNGIELSFVATLEAGTGGLRTINAAAFPTWRDAILGNYAYKDTSGKPALYQELGDSQGETGTVTLSKITASQNGVSKTSGYSLVMADAESTNATNDYTEGFRWTSTSPLESLANIQPEGYYPGCTAQGLGTEEVKCFGENYGGADAVPVGATLVSSEAPTKVSSSFVDGNTGSRQGVAFGVMFSKVEATKNVESRYDSADQFTVTATQDGSEISSGSTSGDGTSATTGESTILSDASGSPITFTEKAASDSVDFTHYKTPTWTCTNNGKDLDADDVKLSDEGRSATVDVKVGDYVKCSVKNEAKFGSLSWSKVDSSDDTTLLDGSEWSLTGPDGTTATVVDNGQNDQDSADGKLSVNKLKWGKYTLTETKAPSGYLLDPNTTEVTVDGDHTDIDLDKVKNVKAEPGLKIKKTADPASGERVNPGQEITYTVTVENTGNVDLTPAKISDDLSDVLDNATYVDGSATATIGNSEAAAPTVDTSAKSLAWSNDLKAGATAKLTYKVKVNDDVTAKDALVNVVTGSGDVPPGVTPPTPNCVPDTAKDNADCTTNHTPNEPGLKIKKTADPASGERVNPGQEITYTVTVENTGNVDLTPAKISDDLSDVLDNATYVDGSATATIGNSEAAAPTVDTSAKSLAWSNDLKAGATAKLTYKVKVNDDVTAKDALVNVVTGSGDVPPGVTPPTPNCVPDTAKDNADCTTNHTPNVPVPPSQTPTPEPSTPTATHTPNQPTEPSTPSEPSSPSEPHDSLPRTGVEIAGALAAAALLIAGGIIAYTAARRRRGN